MVKRNTEENTNEMTKHLIKKARVDPVFRNQILKKIALKT